MKLSNKVALVTGAGGGIGAGIARALAREGARVEVVDLRREAAERIAAEIRNEGNHASSWQLDITDRRAVEHAANEIVAKWGGLDIWVNNAGISRVVPFLECTDEQWDLILRVNLKGTFIGCQTAMRHMLPRHSGVILNMSSQSGKVGASQYAAYCASKFGVIGLTQSLALEYAPDGIRVNAICPGVVFTQLWDDQIKDYARKRNLQVGEVRPYLEHRIPVGRLCTPEDVGRTAVFLASDDAAYITGEAVNLSGGSVMH
jgi:3-hydroxybutyrate dehydrogenase